MTSPPGITPTTHPDLAGNQEGESIRLLQAEAAEACRSLGLRISGSRVRKLVAQFAREGHADAQEFPRWLTRRGDIIELRSSPRACDATRQWGVSSR